MYNSFRILLCISLLSTVPPIYAQTLDEIVVTAQRRTQTLQEIPISASITDGLAIKNQNIKEASDYLSIIPNVTFSEEGQRGSRSISISIRGINNISVLENRGGGSAIGYYFNEVSLAQVSQGTANPQLIDVERIEVLRGPQGTFFGLNSTGGALNVITHSAENKVYGEVNAEIGSYDQRAFSGIYNTPITDKLSLRGVLSFEETPALVENTDPVGGDSGSSNKAYRLSALYSPTDSLSIDGKITRTIEKQDLEELVGTCRLGRSAQNLMSLDAGVRVMGFPFPIPIGIDGGIDDGLGCYPKNDDKINKSIFNAGARDSESIENESTVASAHISYETNWFSVESITAYIDSSNEVFLDLDAIDANYINRQGEDTTDAWSQEVRLSSTGDTLDWVFGGIYFESEQERKNLIMADEEQFFIFTPLSPINQFYQTTDVKSYAFFADTTWHINDNFDLTVGGRYSEDAFKQCAQNLSPGAEIEFTCAKNANTDDFSPRVALTVNLSEDIMTYLSASKGYKPGGSQIEGTQTGGRYDPSFFSKETLWNYELGIKTSLLQNRLRLNAAVFYMDWKDLQVDDTAFIVNPETNRTETATFIRQAEEATSQGFEIEFAAIPLERLEIGGGVGYTDASFGDFDGIARPQGIGPIDLSGEQIPGSAKWTASFYGQYEFDILGYESYVRAEWFYRDEVVPNLDGYFYKITDPAVLGFIENDGDPFPFVSPGYDVLNIRAGMQLDRWRFVLYAENVLDEEYFTGARYGFRMNGVNVRPHPRQFGFKVSYSWE